MQRPPFETLAHINDPRRRSTSHHRFIPSLRVAKGPTMECHTLRLSIRSLKSSTVSIAEVFDQIQTFLKWSVVPIAALIAMVFISSARPASAGEYCRKDVTSQVVSCSFDTVEQCQWTSSGRGGDCFRHPWLPPSHQLAYAPHALDAVPMAHHVADHSASNAQPDKLRPRFSHQSRGRFFS